MDTQDTTMARRLKAKDELIAELRGVVLECVNFLADLNTASPFLSEHWVLRSKALHKRAYIVHSKTKGR